jgi:hypothetical protein
MALVAHGGTHLLPSEGSPQAQGARADTFTLALGEGCTQAQEICNDVSLVGRCPTHCKSLGFLASLLGLDLLLLEPSPSVIHLGSPTLAASCIAD